ncbi:relaxase/mobilization nuclease domain-containing protein [Vibrio parahaemolyticus]|nr:relaxase/mobilization nuclease domain-containing protein [Vibrio parahaemolyticus]
MIAKKSQRKSSSKSSFKSLVKYMTRAEQEQADIGQVRISNCGFDDVELAIKEVEATQSINTRSRSDKTYHLIFSFPVGEEPTPEQLEDIEQELCESIGYGEHQRISVVHTDTDNLHVHVAINKIHPISHNIVELKKDYYRLDEACKALELKHGLSVDNRIDGRGRVKDGRESDLSTHSNSMSFKDWITAKSPQLESLLESCQSWQDLQKGLAQYDLELRKRGAGLVISAKNEKAFSKASHVSSNFSFRSLTAKLGEFEVSGNYDDVRVADRYVKAPSYESSHSNELWKQYQSQYQKLSGERKKLLSHLAKDFRAQKKSTHELYNQQREKIRVDRLMSKKVKRKAYQLLSSERKKAIASLSESWKQQREQARRSTPLLNWQSWLVKQAESGNSHALNTLRANPSKYSKAISESAFIGQTRDGISMDVPHKVRANGDIIYNRNIRESDDRIDVNSSDAVDVATALKIATERFGDTLNITGDDLFKRKVVEAAFNTKQQVSFTDPRMNRYLSELSSSRDFTPSNAPSPQHSVVLDWINERNQTIIKTNDISLHRIFKESDSGSFKYGGCRKMKDGSFVALYSNSSETLVVPISQQQVKRYRQHSVGEDVKVNKLGKATFTKQKGRQLNDGSRGRRR